MKNRPVRYYEFPYVKFHGNFYPLIPVTLTYGKKSISTFALLDSGASVCVFRPEIAKALSIPSETSSSVHLGTANGGVDVHMVPVSVQVQQSKYRMKVGFSNRQAATFNILGREGFFKHFSVAFNEIMRTVVLVPLESLS